MEVDAILHMAVIRSLWDNYSFLHLINMTSTRLLVLMAA